MKPWTLLRIVAAALLPVPVLAADMPAKPYAGQEARTIKALPDEDIRRAAQG